jgi:hypothetical protein
MVIDKSPNAQKKGTCVSNRRISFETSKFEPR